MAQQNVKLTTNAGETDVATLLGNSSVFEVPFFQRPYKWSPKNLDQLHSDILALVDGSSDIHFLGAVIVHGMPSNPADPKVYEVIDGQQRLTTLYLHICAAIRTLVDHDEYEEAENLFRKYIVTNVMRKGRSNLALHPSKEDRGDLNAVVREVLDNKSFGERMDGFTFHPLPSTEVRNAQISKNYRAIKRFYRDQFESNGIEGVRQVYSYLLQRISIVQIDVQDPTNGPKIFDSLNSRQEPMTVGDLVRNDVFLKVASSDPELASELDEHHWQPFYRKFRSDNHKNKSHFDEYFFPFGLIKNHNLRKSEVYADLKRDWESKDPRNVIRELEEYQDAFLDLVKGTNSSSHEKVSASRFRRLHELGAPSSTYPFLMRLSRELSIGALSGENGAKVLEVLDSFLTRRAVSGYEPTGLHAVFKRLWDDCGQEITADRVMCAIADHKTVAWPGNEEVMQNVRVRPIYGSSIAKYLILQLDEAMGGDKAGSELWIEHVLPDSQSSGWPLFSTDDHKKLKNLFANLLPLSSEMNSSLGNRSYAEKRAIYSSDSMFKSARTFAEEYDEWGPNQLMERGQLLAKWFIERWPHAPANLG